MLGRGTFSAVDAGEVSGRGRGGGVTTSVDDGEADVVDSPGPYIHMHGMYMVCRVRS